MGFFHRFWPQEHAVQCVMLMHRVTLFGVLMVLYLRWCWELRLLNGNEFPTIALHLLGKILALVLESYH